MYQHRPQLASGTPRMGATRSGMSTRDYPMPQAPPKQPPPPPPSPQRPPDFVVYYQPNCRNSQHILQLLQQYPMSQIYAQDVNLLQTRPQWLVGTPMLADTKLGLVYQGADATTFIQKLCGLQEQHRRKQEVNTLPPEPPRSQITQQL